MKKHMLAFVAIACAIAANAATVSWTITNVQKADTTKLTSGSIYVFFAADAATASSQIAALNALAGTGSAKMVDAMGSANWSGTKKATAAGNFSMGTSAAAGSQTLPTLANLGLNGETTYYSYAVIFDTESITDDSNFIVTASKAVTTATASTATNSGINFGSQSANTSWMAVSVPEPTSGLMLLLGMAGLALRRRRA